MWAMAVSVQVVVVDVRVHETKAHTHNARADDFRGETGVSSTQQGPPVVVGVIGQVLF